MTVEQMVRQADSHTGADLGRTVLSEVRDALRVGADRDQLIAMVTTLYDHLGVANRTEDQDAIAEVLDSLTGFCSPSVAL
ncbi:MAG: hypothetical protein M3Z66_07110 [Chloroflexota bacterium]|nr:hypothetical protein [Chloroflexota bacterium]